ncbi:hypothetical protein IE81DRAFT_164841 [Ceraceosorus guamensis]|uniref:Secreted protein n=1 Tax=Ceraceosorus guamensis TaxID=1522189 RepID=A0A316WE05_9BASI|nr:hypothetical protein IE81DRAFT_164841 [Ceraceosorus guamensis]PWN45665.1 hypothetical protein IE81DRAFT_164841 [Ceraceosorus guamensis]
MTTLSLHSRLLPLCCLSACVETRLYIGQHGRVLQQSLTMIITNLLRSQDHIWACMRAVCFVQGWRSSVASTQQHVAAARK